MAQEIAIPIALGCCTLISLGLFIGLTDQYVKPLYNKYDMGSIKAGQIFTAMLSIMYVVTVINYVIDMLDRSVYIGMILLLFMLYTGFISTLVYKSKLVDSALSKKIFAIFVSYIIFSFLTIVLGIVFLNFTTSGKMINDGMDIRHVMKESGIKFPSIV